MLDRRRDALHGSHRPGEPVLRPVERLAQNLQIRKRRQHHPMRQVARAQMLKPLGQRGDPVLALGHIGRDLHHPKHLSVLIEDRAIGGLDPDRRPVLRDPRKLVGEEFPVPKGPPELCIFRALGIVRIDEHRMMLALDLPRGIAHGAQEIRVRRDDRAVRLELNRRLCPLDRVHICLVQIQCVFGFRLPETQNHPDPYPLTEPRAVPCTLVLKDTFASGKEIGASPRQRDQQNKRRQQARPRPHRIPEGPPGQVGLRPVGLPLGTSRPRARSSAVFIGTFRDAVTPKTPAT